MIKLAHHQVSRCAVTGATLASLEACSDKLSVDRLDPSLGYVSGNMRLLSLYLNNARGAAQDIPADAIRYMKWKLDRYGKRYCRSANPQARRLKMGAQSTKIRSVLKEADEP